MILDQTFYSENTLVVARSLLGQKLIRDLQGTILAGIIVETEAYLGNGDSASHAYKGMTGRNAIMFGPAGHAYVYFIYGKYHMLNVVTCRTGEPGAVLIRGLLPLEGREHMERYRHACGHGLTDGPAKLCQALNIDKKLNGWNLTSGKKLWIESEVDVPEYAVKKGPRVGIDYALPEHRLAPWRYRIDPGK
jgi:DNA-3-methyladenine glycosylase